MVLKDHLLAAIKAPQRFLQRVAIAKIRAVRARHPLERRLWTLRSQALSAQQSILLKIAKKRWDETSAWPIPKFIDSFLHGWDPKRDFSYGLLHAEHLTRILADVTVAEILVKHSKAHPERASIAERWIERAEPRVRYNADLIDSTGDRLLGELQSQDDSQT
jgi:hypothetical protein